MIDDKDAEELTQEYFHRFGGFTCSWENVQQIISEMLKENAELKKQLEISEQVAGSNPNLFIENCNLKAENAELKETASRAGYRIAELKHEIDELKAQTEKYKTEKKYYDNLCHNKTVECDDLRKGIKQFQFDNEKFIKKIAELNAQIEKMKYCGNCKKERNKPEPLAIHVSCAKCKDYSEWELAE